MVGTGVDEEVKAVGTLLRWVWGNKEDDVLGTSDKEDDTLGVG